MSNRLARVLSEAEALSAEERAELIARLSLPVRVVSSTPTTAVRWSDLRGMAKAPLYGEDAQVAISRARRQADRDFGTGEGTAE